MDFTTENTDDLLALYLGLKNAYWYANSISDKDTLTGAAEAVQALITEINAGAIRNRNDAYANESLHVAATVATLNSVKDNIAQVVKNIDKAGKLVKLITKVTGFL